MSPENFLQGILPIAMAVCEVLPSRYGTDLVSRQITLAGAVLAFVGDGLVSRGRAGRGNSHWN